jgi:UDP-2,4-diacetamido-2,4,6-trideoxy-beta-L-altropyranose hydrolase
MIPWLVRVDADPQIGLGHLSRTLVLAEALASIGFAPEFVMGAPPDGVRARVEGRGFSVLDVAPIATPMHGEADGRAVEARLAEGSAAGVVVDGYRFDDGFWRSLSHTRAVRVCIDDRVEHAPPCDLLVNANLYAEEAEPKRAAHRAERLFGPRYALLAAPYRAAREQKAQSTPRALDVSARLLVTIGGSDPTNLSPVILAALEALARVRLDVRLVVGPAAKNLGDVQHAAARSRHRIDVLVAPADLAADMAWADVAITAGGTTTAELACVGVPSLVIAVADNQRPVVEALAARRLMDPLGFADDFEPARLVAALSALLADEAERSRMIAAQRAVYDGEGALRVAEAIARRVATTRGKGAP